MSVALVVALTASLPFHLASVFLFAEAAFGLVAAPLRHRHFSRAGGANSSNSNGGSPGDEDDVGGDWLRNGLAALRALLDPSEAHAELLRDGGGKWFEGHWSGQAASELGHENVAEFLSYSLFARRLGGGAAGGGGAGAAAPGGLLRKAASQFIAALGLDIAAGTPHNPEASFIAHTEAPLVSAYRPLTFYLLTEAVAGWNHLKLTRTQGFKLAAVSDVATYYVKAPSAGSSDADVTPPVVFLHGIGLGLAPYTGFLRRVEAQHPGRTVIAVQYKHVSMRLTSRIPTVAEVADDVAAFLADRVGPGCAACG